MTILSALSSSRRLWPAFGALGLLWGGFAAAIPAIKMNLAAGDAAFGLALFGSPVGLLCAMWLAPRMDLWLGARALPVAVVSMALAFVFVGPAGNLWTLAIVMVFVGAASGSLDILTNSRISDAEQVTGASLMNVNHAMFSALYACGAIASGLLREAGWPPVTILTALGLVAVLMATRVGVESAPADDSEDITGGFPRRIVFWGGLALILAFFAENATEAWSALHLERTLGARAAEGALGPGLLGLTMFLGRMGGQVVADRMRPTRLIQGGALLAAAGATLAAAAPTVAVAYAGFIALGFGISILAPMILSVSGARVPARHRTAAIARIAVIGFLGFVIAPPLMGLIAETVSLRGSFAAVALLMIALPLVVHVLKRD